MNLILKILPCCLLWGIVLSDEEEDKKYKSRGMFSLYDLVKSRWVELKIDTSKLVETQTSKNR
ncbi:hypothetical protein B566_EDAN001833, partial [Ephemera danica]